MEIKLPIKIIVKTNSKKTQILSFDKERKAYKVEVKAPPEKNKANIEIEKFFSKLLKKQVRITSGRTSKTKILR